MIKWKVEWDLDFYCLLFKQIRVLSDVTKIRNFQYRLLQRSITTNKDLCRWKIIESEMCTFCKSEIETVLHLFYYCDNAQRLWQRFAIFCKSEWNVQVKVDAAVVISNHFHKPIRHIINGVGLILKHYIYVKRCLNQQCHFDNFLIYLARIKNIEKYISVKNETIGKYVKKWYAHDKLNENMDGFVDGYIDDM